MTETSLQDPRAARSRDALLGAAAELLREREASAITATDVVRQAQVSRPTLYQHFGDLPTLFVAATTAHLHSLFDDALPQDHLNSYEAGLASIEHLLEHLRADASLFRHAIRGPGGFAVLRALTDTLTQRLRTHSPLRTALDSPQAPAQVDEFLAHGTVGLVATWLESDFGGADSVAAMTDRIVSLLAFHLAASTGAPLAPPAVEQAPTPGARDARHHRSTTDAEALA
ncbi:TetR/AcrR family transcriptional regulator [Galactobacter valiniphilus]|uniref:TetR/AcrR family transcriptional regulator n=1 Tax=Galactobacter valiniphilus TaxID=2676122 RepID=UPI001314DD0F|nr:TetR/AcrR family transcriptional regulator [Galactobacter valiniphilus]